MSFIHINKHPSDKDLRWFGVGFLVFVVALGAIVRFQLDAAGVSMAIWAFGATLSVAYVLVRPLRRPAYLFWMYLTWPIGWLLSFTLVAFVFFVVVTPIAVLLRMAKGAPLERKPDRTTNSYWVPRPQQRDIRTYLDQY